MPLPDPEAYREALVASRSRFNTIRREEASRITSELEDYVTFLTGRLEGEFGPISGARAEELRRAREINEQAAQRLRQRLTSGTEVARNTLFEDTLDIWERSGLAAAESVGIDAAALGAVRPPPTTLLGAYESVGAAQNWRTLLRGHISDAATEANTIVRTSMQQGVGFEELERRMRRYVVGSEEFDDAFSKVKTTTGEFTKIDLREIPQDARKAAGQMRFNSRRIAWSEMRNARHEAEVQHMLRDPLIKGVKWRLSPTHDHTDSCDMLARANWYGLGPGVYPVNRVPPPPHPMDACENMSVGRDASKMGDPKPDPNRRLTGQDADLPDAGDMTENQAERIREEAERAVRQGEQALEGIGIAA